MPFWAVLPPPPKIFIFQLSAMESTTTDVNDDSVRQTLHLLERLGVSDDFCHELSMANLSLPWSPPPPPPSKEVSPASYRNY